MFRNPLTDVIVVLVVVLLIFGPKRLPLLGRSLGQGLREFKESITGENKHSEDEEHHALPSGEAHPAAPTTAPERDTADVASSEPRA